MIDTNKAREIAREVKRLGESEGFYDLPEAAALLLQLAEAHDRMAKVIDHAHSFMVGRKEGEAEYRLIDPQCEQCAEAHAIYLSLKDAAMGADNG